MDVGVVPIAASATTCNQEMVHDHGLAENEIRNAHGGTVLVPVGFLHASDSPRTHGEDMEHVRVLAECTAVLPPIVVHRPTMRVIDGMHRLKATKLRGETHIWATFIDGNENDAFVLAVRLNATHGLPLSTGDRVRAAMRIVRTHPRWSDRAIANVTGVSHKTIGAIRTRSAGENLQPNARVGRDGRLRPSDRAERRARAVQYVSQHPDAPLREIARAVGISVSTAKHVRDRLRAQTSDNRDDTEHSEQDRSPAAVDGRNEQTPAAEEESVAKTLAGVVNALKNDPSVRQTDAGRALLRLLGAHSLNADEWRYLTAGVPAHRRAAVADAALNCAKSWQWFARQLVETDT